ncbi:MAG: type secretion system protein VirB10 [Rhodoferax sp.]|nr:type secretion system protein VirB10 [Rhodoferax sp.]
MSAPNSPVEGPASPVGEGHKPPLLRWQKVTLASGAAAFCGLAVAAYVVSHNGSQRDQKPPPPVRQTAQSEPFQPAPLPKATLISASLPSPVRPAVGPSNLAVADDEIMKGRKSPIMATNTQVAGVGGAAQRAARPDGELDAMPRQSELGDRLTGTELPAARAKELPDPNFLIAQGRVIPCLQATKLDSTYPGFVSAVIPTAIYGETGHVVLLDAGTKIFGSMERAMTAGVDRQFVLWKRATTPPIYDARGKAHQYSIALNSPAADELGATGLDGDVNRHIWRKLGGAIMLSVLEGGIQAGTAALQPQGGTSINLGGGGGLGQLPSQLLASTINIPDVLTRNQGTTCSIFTARDLDMSSIYKLRRR